MNIKQLSDLLQVAPNTIRNWTSTYGEFLTARANPPSGKKRVLTELDLRILNYVAALKNAGEDQDAIFRRLQELHRDNWADLPTLPPQWRGTDDTVSVAIAASRASEIAQVAVLQSELQNTRQALEAAQAHVEDLSHKLDALQGRFDASENEKTTLRIELERAKGEVQTLQAQIAGYSLAYGMGRGKPISVFVIIVAALLIGAVLVIIAMIVGALVG